ncbi:helix-turn-helix domain-containing protein [Brucella intermedia]
MATRHLSQIELAARWNISHRTLERWRWTGEGPQYVKLGGRVVYRLEDVEAYEAEQISPEHIRPSPSGYGVRVWR